MNLETKNGSLYYELQAVNGSRPTLYLHSALGSSEEMRPIAERFAERTAIFLDFPGHGKSTAPPQSLTITSLAESISELLDHLQITNADIVGYSLGGYVGLELASSEPQKVRSVASHAMKYYWTPEAIEGAVQTFAKAPAPEAAIRVTESVIRDFTRRQLSPSEIRNSGRPVFLSTGERDEFVTAAEVIRLAVEIGEGTASSMVFTGAGHSLKKLSMEGYEKAVREFWSA